MALPKPPINTMTDFVVFCFVSIVALLLFLSAGVVAVLAFTDPDGDRSQITGQLADILTTLIGALIGFIAGKGQGRSEVHDEHATERAEIRAEEREARLKVEP